ncbi:u19-ctenitoxin-Pn1a [Caerostris extrusa]|uniref:U19-ctenitoxin-Pn1a n=1 Tax=Caerostris extrusa TaxID=172846 RepID=A0AAV4MJ34_CAEEX|nr:u19-ctenitoxin-Pn1a [Caerostris extrusa]
MRGIFAIFLLACVVFVGISAEGCGTLESCGEGQCCAGSFYHRFCRDLSDDGMPCEQPNRAEHYSVACPCKEGLVCNVLPRCQPI